MLHRDYGTVSFNFPPFLQGVRHISGDICFIDIVQEFGICEDRIQVGGLEGALNIENISEEDIPGNIVIYYKNVAGDVFYGGITYRVTIEGGLKADEIRQVMSAHFNADNSEIVMVSCGG